MSSELTHSRPTHGGLEGVIRAFKKVDKEMSELPTSLKIVSALSAGFIVGGCVEAAVNTAPAPLQEKAKEAFDSFNSTFPEFEGREKYAIVITLPLKEGNNSNIIVMPSNEAEKSEIIGQTCVVDGQELPIYDNARVFTTKTGSDESQKWEELRGCYENPSDQVVKTVWYDIPDSGTDLTRKVYEFSSNSNVALAWPLVEPSTAISWSSDLSSRNEADYTPWDGVKAFEIPLNSESSIASKPLLAPLEVSVGGTPFVFQTPDGGLTSVTPEGEIINQISAEIQTASQEFFGSGFEVKADGKLIDKTTGKEVPGFTIVTFNENTMINTGKVSDPVPTWTWKRVYEFKDKEDFTVYGTQYDTKILDNSGFDLYGSIYENGEFQRQLCEFAGPNGTTVKLECESPQEVQYEIMTNNSANPTHRIATIEALREMNSELLKVKIKDGKIYFTYGGMEEEKGINDTIWGKNFIPVRNGDGSWSKVDTAEFLVHEIGDRSRAFVVWYDKNDQPVIIIIEGKYLDLPGYFNDYWKTHDISDAFTG